MKREPLNKRNSKSRRSFFNEEASTWDARFQTEALASFLKEFVPRFGLLKGQKILDVGSGTGVLIPFLAQAVESTGLIVATDFAEKMLHICRRKCSVYTNVMVGQQSVEKLGFVNECFDAITCFGLFPHIENKERALDEMNRVLKQNGTLVIAHALSTNEIKAHHHNAPTIVADDELPEEEKMRYILQYSGFAVRSIEDKHKCYLCLATKTELKTNTIQKQMMD